MINETFESVCIEINFLKKKYKIIGVYRPSSSSLLAFNDSFFGLLTNNDKKGFLMISGDLNVDFIAKSHSYQKSRLFDELKSLHLLNLIDIPTRTTNNSATCLDHLYVNSAPTCISGVLTAQISDHFPVFCLILNQHFPENSNISIKFRDTCKRNLDIFKYDVCMAMQSFDVYDVLNINDRFKFFITLYLIFLIKGA